MRLSFLIIFLFVNLTLLGQIKINFTFDSKPLIKGEKFNFDTTWIKVEELKFYLVYTPFFSDENTTGSSIIHLVDFNDSSSYIIPFTEDGMKNPTSFDFAIGLDSSATMSTQFSGALDPALGMYWAWNTGYIHFKLEGTSNLCSTKNQEFQYHIGGYSGKFATQRWLTSPVSLNNQLPFIEIDIASFFKEVVNLKEKPLIMIPGNEAIFFANNYFRMFKK